MSNFAQFKSILITGLASLVIAFVVFIYNAQAQALDKATADIVDIKIAVVELKTIVIELKKSNERLTEYLYERRNFSEPAVAKPRPR